MNIFYESFQLNKFSEKFFEHLKKMSEKKISEKRGP